MGISVIVESHVDVPERMRAIRDDAFWLYAATEWHRLYTPYVPMQTGALCHTVEYAPREITHTVPYARKQYEGHFQHRTDKHPLASREWDKAAIPTQQPKLVATLQNAINSGRFRL